MTLLPLTSLIPSTCFPVCLPFLFISCFVLFGLASFWLLSQADSDDLTGVVLFFKRAFTGSIILLWHTHTNTSQVPFMLERKESFGSRMLIFYHSLFNISLLWEDIFSLCFLVWTPLCKYFLRLLKISTWKTARLLLFYTDLVRWV